VERKAVEKENRPSGTLKGVLREPHLDISRTPSKAISAEERNKVSIRGGKGDRTGGKVKAMLT